MRKLSSAAFLVCMLLVVTHALGVPLPGAAAITVVLKVTVCPNVEGLADELTVVLLEALPTVSVRLPLLLVKLPLPP